MNDYTENRPADPALQAAANARRAAILAAASASRAPTRSRARVVALALAAVVIATALLALQYMGFHHGLPRPPLLVFETVGGAAMVTALSLWLAWGRNRSMLGPSSIMLVALAFAVPIVLFAWKLGWTWEDPAQRRALFDSAFLVRQSAILGAKCFWIANLTGAIPLAALLYVRRFSEPVHPTLTGLGFGIAAGAWSWLIVDFWCPECYVPHILRGHLLPLVLLGISGAVAGHFVLRLRRIRTS